MTGRIRWNSSFLCLSRSRSAAWTGGAYASRECWGKKRTQKGDVAAALPAQSEARSGIIGRGRSRSLDVIYLGSRRLSAEAHQRRRMGRIGSCSSVDRVFILWVAARDVGLPAPRAPPAHCATARRHRIVRRGTVRISRALSAMRST